MVLVVWFQVGNKEEERFFVILVVIDVANNRIGLSINAVTWKFYFLIVLIEKHAVVSVRNKFENIGAEPVFIATAFVFWNCAIRCTKMPLANVAGGIACIFIIFRQGCQIGI